MKIAQYVDLNTKKITEKSFQREIWEQHWSESSLDDLILQLKINPIYWNLLGKIKKKDRILEAGCGFGQWVAVLTDLGFNIKGVDIAGNTIKKIKKTFPKASVSIADVESLPFKDESFDVYLSFGVIEHFKQGPKKVLGEAKRVLRKNGLLYLTIPYLNPFRFIRYAIFNNKKGQFYQYLYSEKEIIRLIEKAGFEVESIKHFDFINAIRKDIPLVNHLLDKILNTNFNKLVVSNGKFNLSYGQAKNLRAKKLSLMQKVLYKLDSYIILVEAKNIN